jgi:hypothetical protein
MTFRCLDCNQQIEGDLLRYDPFGHAANRDAQDAQLTGVVTHQPDLPTPASAPFHKACLERRWETGQATETANAP